MKKLNISKLRSRLMIAPAILLLLGGCSDDSQTSDAGFQKKEAVKNFKSAVERVNSIDNVEKRAGETDKTLNDRRAAILTEEAKKVLLSTGRSEKELQSMPSGKMVSAAFQICINEQKQ